eukprot:246505_1
MILDTRLYIATIVFCVCFLAQCIVSLLLVYRVHHDGSTIRTKTKLYSICSCIFYFLTILNVLIGELLVASRLNAINWFQYNLAAVSTLWATATISTYLLYIERLHSMFSNTTYQPPMYIYLLLYILCCIYFIGQIIETIIQVLGLLDMISASSADDFSQVILPMELFCDFLLSTILLSIFVNKMFLVTKTSFDNEEKSICLININDGSNKFIFNQRQSKFLHLITKQTLLTITVIISTDITLLYGIAYTVIGNNRKPQIETLYTMDLCAMFLYVMDSFVNSFVVFLSFKFSENAYQRICGSYHKHCNRLCHNITKKKLDTKDIEIVT